MFKLITYHRIVSTNNNKNNNNNEFSELANLFMKNVQVIMVKEYLSTINRSDYSYKIRKPKPILFEHSGDKLKNENKIE